MPVMAAPGDTWGIPGSTFLVLYLTAVVSVAVLAAVHRSVLFAGTRGAQVDQLGPQQIAYLNGGDRLAVYAALGGLRGAGAISSAPDKTLWQSGPMPGGVTPLDTAVYNAAGKRIRARDVINEPWVRSALDQLRAGLEASGLAVSATAMRTARLWVLAGLALIAVGVLRLFSGMADDRPVGFLFIGIIAAVLVTLTLRRGTRHATTAARKSMSQVRRKYDYLSPQQSPSYATYGAAGAAMGVALFGAASLYTMDPAFAAEAEIQRHTAGGDGGSYGGGDSGSSGSSCGGGGGGCGGGGGGCGG